MSADQAPPTVLPLVGWIHKGGSKAHLFDLEDVKAGRYLIRAACGRPYNGGVIDGMTPKCSKCNKQAHRPSPANIRDQVLRPAARFLPCKKRDAGLNNLQHLVRASILSCSCGPIFRRLETGFELLSMDWKITGFIVVLVRFAKSLGRSPSACASPW